MKYTAPTPEDLQVIKNELGLTQGQMAEFIGLGGGNQWRKYTGGQQPRSMSYHMLFYLAAKLTLTDEQISSVKERMQSIGADVE